MCVCVCVCVCDGLCNALNLQNEKLKPAFMQITWPTKADSRVLCRCEEDAYYCKIMIVNDIHVEISWMGKKQG